MKMASHTPDNNERNIDQIRFRYHFEIICDNNFPVNAKNKLLIKTRSSTECVTIECDIVAKYEHILGVIQ